MESDRPQVTVRRMRIECCIPKATNTHSQYVTVIAFPLLQWLREPPPTPQCYVIRTVTVL